jgi:hypothetical protein
VVSAVAAAVNAVVSSTASCAAGKVALGGGARVTTTAVASRAVIQASYPSAAGTWTAAAVATANLGAGNTMTVTAYVICSL